MHGVDPLFVGVLCGTAFALTLLFVGRVLVRYYFTLKYQFISELEGIQAPERQP